MAKLSVNINKIATLRNARGGNVPDLLQVAKDVQKFGAEVLGSAGFHKSGQIRLRLDLAFQIRPTS